MNRCALNRYDLRHVFENQKHSHNIYKKILRWSKVNTLTKLKISPKFTMNSLSDFLRICSTQSKKLESAIFVWWPPNFFEIIFRYLLNFLRGGLCISLPNSEKMDFLCVTTLFSNNFSTVIFKEARAKGVFQIHQFLVRRICSVHFLSTTWMWKMMLRV